MHTNSYLVSYKYDDWDRLIREDNKQDQKTYMYYYNDGGNITSKRAYAYTTADTPSGTYTNYSYGYDNNWKDKMTSYNGQDITYDAAGNPTSYLDLTLTWQNGKQLKTVANAKHGGTTWGTVTMEYDASGLRTKKSRSGGINTCEQYYYWQGNKLLAEQHGSLFLYYYYDETGVCGFNRAGADYYFQKNILGDIIAIYNTSGIKVGSYEYDAWGNTTVTNYTSDIIADWNPFRYRGYYQDQETGFYYLQSRYYDPQTGRFINADEPKIATLGLGIVQGSNLYAYCLNNPVMIRTVSYGGNVSSGGAAGGGGLLNYSLANGSFRNGALYGKGSITVLYAEWQVRAQWNITKGNINIGVFGKFSLLNANGEIGIGDSNFGLALKGVVDVGVVTGFAGIIINPSKNDYFIGIEAKAAVALVRGGVQLTLFGVPIEVGGQLDIVGAGIKLGAGIKDGEFYWHAGGGFLLVPSFYIRIKIW